MTMPRLTNEAKKILRENKDNEDLSLADFRSIIQEKLDETYSRQGISNFLKTLPSKPILTNLDKMDNKLDTKNTQKSTAVPRKKGFDLFDLSIDKLKTLLDQNSDHTFHDTLLHQFIGTTKVINGKQHKTGGKLRANLMQLISFLKDVTN